MRSSILRGGTSYFVNHFNHLCSISNPSSDGFFVPAVPEPRLWFCSCASLRPALILKFPSLAILQRLEPLRVLRQETAIASYSAIPVFTTSLRSF